MTTSEYPITLLSASLLALVYFVLCYNVVRHRIKNLKGKDFDKETLDRTIRVQVNFIEYVPIILILFFLLENANINNWALLSLSIALIIGRLLHAQGLSSSAGTSFGRFYGTLLTWIVLVISGLLGLVTIF